MGPNLGRGRLFRIALAVAAVVACLVGGKAEAQDVFAPDGLVELLPATPVFGASERMASLGLVALRPDGTPRRGMQLTVESNRGDVGPVEELRDGVYVWTFTPGAVDADLQVTMTVRTQSEDGSEVLLTAPVFVRPTVPLAVASDDAEGVPSTLSLEGADRLLVRSSAGTLSAPTPDADGMLSTKYTANDEPATNLTIVMVDAADPFGRYGFSMVGPAGRVEQQMWAAPGSEVTLTVGDRVYGPVKSDVDGRATLAVEVPKGVTTALQTTTSFDGETRIQIPLTVESQPVVALFPLPHTLPASGGEVPLRAVVRGADGTGIVPTFDVEAGTIGESRSLGNGVWLAPWTLPDEPGTPTVRVALDGGITDEMVATVVAAPPRSLTLTSDAAELSQPVLQPIELTGKIAGPGSLGLVVDGGVLTAEPMRDDEGAWSATVSPSGTDLEIQGYVKAEVSQDAVAAVALVPERSVIPAGQRVDLLVASLDAFGRPVPNVEVSVTAESGRLFPPRVITGPHGVARVVFQPSGALGLTAIEATSGSARGATGVISARYGSALRLPATGDALSASVVESWRSTVRNVWMAGKAPAPVGPMMIVSLDPPRAEPGSTVSVIARAIGDDGAPLKDPDVSFSASLGEIGPKATSADGVLSATWSIPEDAAGDVTVSASSGDLFDVLVIPFGGEPVSSEASSDAVATVDPEEEVEEKKPKKEKKPKEPRSDSTGDFPWLRARVSGIGSVYRYQQTPSDDPGPLLAESFSVGGAAGGSPASPYGGELDVRAWGDELGLSAVGLRALVRITGYAIEAPAFDRVINDTLTQVDLDVLGRLPIELGSNRFWVGGKAGFHRGDFITFEACEEPGCDVNVQPLGALALGLGAEVGADLGRLFVVAGYSGKFAGAEAPYSNAFDAEVGFGLTKNVYVDAGFGILARSADLVGVQSDFQRGVVEDSQLLFRVGAGFAL